METDAAAFFNPISSYVFFVRAITLIKIPTCSVLKFAFIFHTTLKCIQVIFNCNVFANNFITMLFFLADEKTLAFIIELIGEDPKNHHCEH